MKVRVTINFDEDDRRRIGHDHLATREELLQWANATIAGGLETEANEESDDETEWGR